MQHRKKKTEVFDSIKVATILVEELGRLGSLELQNVCKRVQGALRARNIKAADDIISQHGHIAYDPESAFIGAQLASITKRLEGHGYDPVRTAIKRWNTAEWRCKWVNRRIRSWISRSGQGPGRKPYLDQVTYMQRFILSVLGDSPPLDAILDGCRFGPGTSIGVGGDSTHFIAKMMGSWSVNRSCAPYAARAMSRLTATHEMAGLVKGPFRCLDYEAFNSWFTNRVVYQEYDEALLVDKNAKTKRFICKQQTLTSFCQLGVGDWMSRRLLDFGCDLSDQGVNQRLAREGSGAGFNTWATLDLEMASDTISYEVVKLLLPPAWFHFLCRLRSSSFRMIDEDGGDVRTYEKFSAMGNGFTFPLETLIFMAAAHAAGDQAPTTEFSVYGDDIICKQSSALELISLLNFLGFRVNEEKSFIFGSFKESCGADFYDG